MHLLVVEDDNGVNIVYKQKLARLIEAFPDATVTFTPTLAEARRIVSTFPFPNLAIIDLTLKDADWMTTVNALPEFTAHAPVLVVTGQPVEKVKAVLTDPDIEVVQKSPDLFIGNIFVEYIAKVLNRHAEKETQHLFDNVKRLQDLLYSDASPTPP